MAAHTIRKASRQGIGCSVIDLAGIDHVFAVARPRRGATLRQQADDALGALGAMAKAEGVCDSIVEQSVFVADINEIAECRQLMRDHYGDELPATSYIPQRPCDGTRLVIEAVGIKRDGRAVEIQRAGEQLVIARHNGLAWVHAAQVTADLQATNVYDGAMRAFQEMRTLLCDAHVRFDRVIRTWLYLGGIVEAEGAAQRYQELNRARTDFYRGLPFLTDYLPADYRGPVYPASTGIGADGQGFGISALALVTDRNDVVAVPLENPRQTAAYDYAACYSPKSPKFSRAMALAYGEVATIFVSGTASITHSETRHVGDATAQTQETLENIAALISEENLSRHGLPGLGTSLESLGLIRVYVKRQEDYAATRAVCEKYLGDLPTVYTLADVCRPELLVEIEAMAFSKRPAGVNNPSPEAASEDQPTDRPAVWPRHGRRSGAYCA
jgi:enamine deaminase RidA (YjgF/YER057c/UK114 family)